MSVGFGFSAGDFISALQLVSTVISALQSSSTSSSEFRSLIAQLHTLESALLRVKRLDLHESQHGEVIALRQAAAQCQGTIDAFWEKCRKYQPSLGAMGSGSRLRDGWRKIKWAVCKREDVVRFKADLMAHTESIELLLTTVQMAATRISERKNDDSQRTLAGRMQDSYFGCMQRMSVILERISSGIKQGQQLVEMTAQVIQTNVQIFQVVLNIQRIITRIPGQIEREQPVYFMDALGRLTPFHLEFITSASSLTLVLQNNFRNIGSGATKIGKGEFAIQDSITKLDVDLDSPWEVCFCPGQKVAMSMVFNSAKATNMYCPKCREDNGDDFSEDEDIECRKCGVVYRRSISWTSPQPLPSFSMTTAQITPKEIEGLDITSERNQRVVGGKRKRAFDEDEEMALFRRVRIKTSIILPAEDSRPGSPTCVEESSRDEEPSEFDPNLKDLVERLCAVIRGSEPACTNRLSCNLHTLEEKQAARRMWGRNIRAYWRERNEDVLRSEYYAADHLDSSGAEDVATRVNPIKARVVELISELQLGAPVEKFFSSMEAGNPQIQAHPRQEHRREGPRLPSVGEISNPENPTSSSPQFSNGPFAKQADRSSLAGVFSSLDYANDLDLLGDESQSRFTSMRSQSPQEAVNHNFQVDKQRTRAQFTTKAALRTQIGNSDKLSRADEELLRMRTAGVENTRFTDNVDADYNTGNPLLGLRMQSRTFVPVVTRWASLQREGELSREGYQTDSQGTDMAGPSKGNTAPPMATFERGLEEDESKMDWIDIREEFVVQAPKTSPGKGQGTKRRVEEVEERKSSEHDVPNDSLDIDTPRRFKKYKISHLPPSPGQEYDYDHYDQQSEIPQGSISDILGSLTHTTSAEAIRDTMTERESQPPTNATDRSMLDSILQGEMYNRSFWGAVRSRETAEKRLNAAAPEISPAEDPEPAIADSAAAVVKN